MVIPLKANRITKYFGDEQVLDELNLQLHPRETLSILGRSGCGKTTLLKILGGLESPDGGNVLINGTNVRKLRPQERDIVYLYQEALLFPHLNVFENIAFGLRLRKFSDDVIASHTNQMIERLGLAGMAQKMPHQLSGGQQQRVSFGRALITNPSVLLLDEPFGSLDADTRHSMQQFFTDIADEFDITAIFVTHNVKEAMLMGDRIGSLSNGKLSIFDSVDAFINSDNSIVQDEISFWESIQNRKSN
ncbi:MAG: ABC transporter ATP-binding protein [Fodinibius sp.]|nr:ABC transporter ATP-binding protein [Fodinibius sp.]